GPCRRPVLGRHHAAITRRDGEIQNRKLEASLPRHNRKAARKQGRLFGFWKRWARGAPTRPRCDCAVTSAVRGGILDHPRIPTVLKTQPLRPNWTELNWRTAGSTPVSATMFSQTYGLCATTRHDAQLSSRVPSQQNPTMLSAVGSPAMGAY